MSSWSGRRVMELRASLIHPGIPCGLCGTPITSPASAHLDHWVPRSAGGSDDLSNLVVVHSWCNLRKGAGHRPPIAPRSVIAQPKRNP